MEAKYKQDLNDNVAKLIEDEVLDNVFITEFLRQFDNQNQISSLDMTRMANSILTCPTDFNGGRRVSGNWKNLIKGPSRWPSRIRRIPTQRFPLFLRTKKATSGCYIISSSTSKKGINFSNLKLLVKCKDFSKEHNEISCIVLSSLRYNVIFYVTSKRETPF